MTASEKRIARLRRDAARGRKARRVYKRAVEARIAALGRTGSTETKP